MAFSTAFMEKMNSLNIARTLFLKKQPFNVLRIVFLELLMLPFLLFLVMELLNAEMEVMKIARKTR